MSKYFLLVNIIISVITTSGCNDKTSVEWYVNNHDDLVAKYTECLLTDSWHDIACKNVRSAKNLEANELDIQEGLKVAQQELFQIRESLLVSDLNTLSK